MALVPTQSASARRARPAASCVVWLGLAVAGCGSGATGVPDAGVTINGHPFSAMAQAALHVFKNNDTNVPDGWYVELSDQFNGCIAIMTAPPDETVLQFKLPESGPGIYDVTPSNTVFIVAKNNKRDANAATPSTGKLQLLSVDKKHLVGTYDVTFKSGERLNDRFDAELCQ